MAKLIHFEDFIRKKNSKKEPPQLYSTPMEFADLGLRITALALKDLDIIYKNVKYNYYHQYVEYIQENDIVDEYSFLDYIGDYLSLEEPFEIKHGVDFSGGESSLKRLSDNDWENIADMVVRLSLTYSIKGINDFDLLPLAEQYDWDFVLLNTSNSEL